MSELLRNIDARTRLAGTNKLEILLFTLGTDPRTGRRETFGINVFKVREVMRTPPITAGRAGLWCRRRPAPVGYLSRPVLRRRGAGRCRCGGGAEGVFRQAPRGPAR